MKKLQTIENTWHPVSKTLAERHSLQHAFACACRVIDEPAITHPNIRHTKGVPILMGSAPLARRADYFH
jgi:hypothetical protein